MAERDTIQTLAAEMSAAFERFVAAAGPMLGLGPGQEFTAEERDFAHQVASHAMSHLLWKYRRLFRWLPARLREKVEMTLALELLDSLRWASSTVLCDQGFSVRQDRYADTRPEPSRN
jgi:hypothetical protein